MPYQNKPNDTLVAPFTGVWIEIGCTSAIPGPASVAPFTGAWIEIVAVVGRRRQTSRSHPSRVRGLKSSELTEENKDYIVAPFTGAWIEIHYITGRQFALFRRTLYGCVD